MGMNPTQVASFTAVAETGGFGRAAARLGISQPAVSLHVAELEADVGAKVFDRLPRGVRLTAAGEVLLGYARRLSALEAEARAAVAELMGLGRGRLAIGASLTLGSYLMPGVLAEFRRRHPAVELRMEVANTDRVTALVRDEQVELGLTEGLAEHPDLAVSTFHTDRLVAIAPPGHRLARAAGVTARDLFGEPFVAREAGSGTRAVVEAAAARKRLTVRSAVTVGSLEAVKRAVIAGMGVSVVSELAVAAEVAAGTLAVVAVADLPIWRPLHLARRRDRPDGPAAAALVRLLAERVGPKRRPAVR